MRCRPSRRSWLPKTYCSVSPAVPNALNPLLFSPAGYPGSSPTTTTSWTDPPAVYALAHPNNHPAVATLGRVGLRAMSETVHQNGADRTLYVISRRDVDSSEERRSLGLTD